MSYAAVSQMANNASLLDRIAACAATEGIDNPHDWARTRMWQLAASPGWADSWAYAVDTWTVNIQEDTGKRTDVISDDNILAAVQAQIASP